MPAVRFENQPARDLPDGSPVRPLLGPADLTPDVVAARVKPADDPANPGEVFDLVTPLPAGHPLDITLIRKSDPIALDVLRHSTAHVMARAVQKLYPGTQFAFGPAIENGFYYDMLPPTPIGEEDLPKIEEEMRAIVKKNEPFERYEQATPEARAALGKMGQEFKVEHIDDDLKKYPTLSFYRQGEFLDLCRGPHVPAAGTIGAFKLTSLAGAYWKNDASKPQLQRLYGTAWFTQEELDAYLHRLAEARKRDHRVIGKQLKLFTVSQDVGPGLVLWMPKGAMLREVLQNFIKDELVRRGYQQVFTPHIGRIDLYKTSGHFPYYAKDQFPVLKDDEDEHEQYLLKPMNCPHHIQIYKAEPRSYRDLPLRLAEFGTVYRYEQSGELSGMLRVRGFTQDDAHLFVTPEQLEGEFKSTLELTELVLKSVGMTDFQVRVSLRDPKSDKYVGPPELWDKAEATLKKVVADSGLPHVVALGEAAFYGPKADFIVADALGRKWQLGTVQIDYNLPERFKLEYTGADNHTHRPVMIHRAPFGSMERFVGVLIEHFAGAFPLWLAPEQARVMPISNALDDYGRDVAKRLRAAGLRVGEDYGSDKIGAKIKVAQEEKVPYMVVVGKREAADGKVALRHARLGDLGAVPLDEAVARLTKEAADRVIQ